MNKKEKTTVSGSSVGADVKQPLCNNNNHKSITKNAEAKQSTSCL